MPILTPDRSQGELAAELGTTRSTLNRALNGFVDLGLITRDGARLILRKPAELAAYTEMPIDPR